VRAARARGADVVVLDDGFQHRRIRRNADWVLVSADRWTNDRVRLLPAGPWREPIGALQRASLLVITRKAVGRAAAEQVRDAVRREAAGIAVAIVYLAADGIRRFGADESRGMDSLRGIPVRLIAAIGDPRALHAQLLATGAIVDPHFFPDHHAFTDAEVGRLASRASSDAVVLCTLKDAVKIGPRWPRAAPALWYVSQRVIVEEGLDQLSRSIGTVLSARFSASDSTGPGRSSY
jgi:tetraacyldisaccharide 4'-kinase